MTTCLFGEIGALEGDLLEQLLHDRVQAARADVLRALVDVVREVGDPVDARRA